MRICLVTENFYPEKVGAVPLQLIELMRHLKQTYSDLQIDVVTTSNVWNEPDGVLAPFELWQGIRIFRVNCARTQLKSAKSRLLAGIIFSLKAAYCLLKVNRKTPIDIVMIGTNPPSSALAASLVRRLADVPYLYLIHDLYPDMAVCLGALRKDAPMIRVARRMQHGWLTRAAAVVINGRCMLSRLRDGYGVSAQKLHIINHWGSPDQTYYPGKETGFREAHGLTGFLVVYAGNIGPAQDIDNLLDAAKIVGSADCGITFVLVGGGALEKATQARIRDEAITNVVLIPRVPPDAYGEVVASANVCLVSLNSTVVGLAVPSKTFGILAAGRAIIAVIDAASEIARLVHENDCGVVVQPGHPAELAEVVMALHTGGETVLRHMERQSQRAFAEHFTLDKIASRYHDLFLRLTDRDKS